MKFRKKPIVIEAIRWEGYDVDPILGLGFPSTSFRRRHFRREDGSILAGGCLIIETLEGDMVANPGDWIIRGVKGELYPCKPDIFSETYEAI